MYKAQRIFLVLDRRRKEREHKIERKKFIQGWRKIGTLFKIIEFLYYSEVF